MTNEDKILCFFAQLDLDDHDKEELQKLLASPPDWQIIYASAIRNGLLPILHQKTKRFPEFFPKDFCCKTAKFAFRNSAHNLLLTSELVKISSRFKTDSILLLSFKGPLLSMLLYGDIGQRSFGDIDILITENDILLAYEIMLSLHYTPELQLSPKRLLQYVVHEDNLSFRNTTNNVIVELHWDLAGAYIARPLLLQDLKTIPDQFTISGCALMGLANEYLLVYLCVHGAKHKWERMEWIRSVAVLLENEKNINWESTLQFSELIQCRRMMLLGLLLSRDLFNSKLPQDISQKINYDKRLYPLKKDVTKGLFINSIPEKLSPLDKRFSFFHLKVRDNIFDSIRYQIRLIFRPTNVEWKTISLPASLSFLYFIIRPFRLLTDIIRSR